MFFSSVLIAKGEGFAESTLDSKMIAAGNVLKHFKATASVPFDLQGREATELTYFFGPNKFALLKELDENEPEGAEWEEGSNIGNSCTAALRGTRVKVITRCPQYLSEYDAKNRELIDIARNMR